MDFPMPTLLSTIKNAVLKHLIQCISNINTYLEGTNTRPKVLKIALSQQSKSINHIMIYRIYQKPIAM